MSPFVPTAAVTAVLGSAWLWVAVKKCVPARATLGPSFLYSALAISALFYTAAVSFTVAAALS